MEDKESFVCYDVAFESSLRPRLSKQMEAQKPQSRALLLTDPSFSTAFLCRGPITASAGEIFCQILENKYISSGFK